VRARTSGPVFSFRRVASTTCALTVAAGLSLTMVVPANAASLNTPEASAHAAVTATVSTATQTYAVPTTATGGMNVERDGFTATTDAQLAAAHEAAAAKAAAVDTILASPSLSTTTTATTIPLANTTIGGQIVDYAEQYVGKVPYVIDGASPSQGFDCSGLVMYVLAHFGIAVPHDVDAIAALGTVIPESTAVAGDMVVYPHQHIGIYMGGGMMVDAPVPGQDVTVQAVWGSPEYVRIPGA
jgi:cell wall-associated NlpC family hydrolase